jgi:hypothetical protein
MGLLDAFLGCVDGLFLVYQSQQLMMMMDLPFRTMTSMVVVSACDVSLLSD